MYYNVVSNSAYIWNGQNWRSINNNIISASIGRFLFSDSNGDNPIGSSLLIQTGSNIIFSSSIVNVSGSLQLPNLSSSQYNEFLTYDRSNGQVHYMARKYSVIVGNGFVDTFVINHGLNTKDVFVSILDVGGLATDGEIYSPGAMFSPLYVKVNTPNTLTVTINPTPYANQFKVIVTA
ncbi:hypothetical protein [Microcystis phage Mel-JY01]